MAGFWFAAMDFCDGWKLEQLYITISSKVSKLISTKIYGNT